VHTIICSTRRRAPAQSNAIRVFLWHADTTVRRSGQGGVVGEGAAIQPVIGPQ
jgi:hypothetical protein